MSIANKTSLKVSSQLPEFIRSDENYQTFVAFLQAYYEWMEQQNIGSGKEGALYGSQSLLNYTDIDYTESGDTYNKFIDYYLNDFLPNFPTDALTDKSKLIKIARELYNTKGTPASYQFLFRALYNSDADIFLTRDVILKASDGKWYVSKSLKVDTTDIQFLNIENLRLFGETSKSIATVERSTRSGTRTEIYISNIERTFQSGEYVRVVDNNNQTVYFKDGKVVDAGTSGATTLRAKIIGSIASIQINAKKRGQLYQGRRTADPTKGITAYSGDPVVFYGGLNNSTDIGATAYVYETTSGSVRDIVVNDGSYGYRPDPNTYIRFIGGGGSGAIANVGAVNPIGQVDVAYIPQDFLSTAALSTKIGDIFSFLVGNTSANLSCSLANGLSFTAFSTYPLDTIIVNNGGGGYTSIPSIIPESLYDTTDPQPIDYLKRKGNLASLGILGPIKIVTPGLGYANGDIINFTGSAGGVGAHAYVNVNSTGGIVSATYFYSNTTNSIARYPLGGLGYKMESLPSLSIDSTYGTGGTLQVKQVLGAGADLQAIPDERGIGAITSFVVENYGEDYISAPKISLKVRDVVISNVTPSTLPRNGEQIYQGVSINSAVFKANVDSVSVLLTDPNNPYATKYVLRTYNYTSNTKTDLQLKITDRGNGLPNLYMDLDTTYNTTDDSGNYLFKTGIRTYGNGAAEATAKFLNGLIIGQGQYIKDDGFPSSFQVLESSEFNNFTYELTVQKSFDAYKDVLLKLLHPSGTKVITINALKSEMTINAHTESYTSNSLPLAFYTGTAGSNATVYGSFANPSNNIIKFDALASYNIANAIQVNSIIQISNTHGPNLLSTVTGVDYTSNTVTVKDNVFLRFANVAHANVITSNDRINIPTFTGQYDLINNGEYSNSQNYMEDMFFVGDEIRLVSNSSSYVGTITYVTYSNNTIFVTPSPSFTNTNSIVSVGRDLVSTDIHIYNYFGEAGTPYLTAQDGSVLISQDNKIITLGI